MGVKCAKKTVMRVKRLLAKATGRATTATFKAKLSKAASKLKKAKKVWTGLLERFNCQAGLTNWREGWSDSKKNWCCNKKGLGCASSGAARLKMQVANDKVLKAKSE